LRWGTRGVRLQTSGDRRGTKFGESKGAAFIKERGGRVAYKRRYGEYQQFDKG